MWFPLFYSTKPWHQVGIFININIEIGLFHQLFCQLCPAVHQPVLYYCFWASGERHCKSEVFYQNIASAGYQAGYQAGFLVWLSVSFYIWSFQEDGETFVKTMSDCWIVGRKSDQRELFVILNQKNANLIEIDGKWFHIRYINSTSCYRS